MVVDYPVRDLIIYKGLDCYDSCVTTYVHNFGFPHELLYDGFWNEVDFQYDVEDQSFCSNFFLENLYSCFGTKIMSYGNFTEQSIYELINRSHILMVKTDLFYYPYSPSFRIHHGPHYFLIHGYDTNDESVFISDPSRKIQCRKMSVTDLGNIQKSIFVFCTEAFSGKRTLAIENVKKLEISCGELVQNLENIECRLEDIFKEEKSISEDSLSKEALLFNRLSNNRFCYLKYLEAYYQSRQMTFNHFAKFWEIAKKYETIKNMLYKCVIMKKRGYIGENIVTSYRMVMAEEQEVARILQDELVKLDD